MIYSHRHSLMMKLSKLDPEYKNSIKYYLSPKIKKRSRTLNGIFLTLKLVKIPNRKLRLTSIIINISGKNCDPILLETMALNTLMTMKRWNTLKLFDTYQQSWNGFEHVAQPRKISYNKNCKIKAKQRRPLTIWT